MSESMAVPVHVVAVMTAFALDLSEVPRSDMNGWGEDEVAVAPRPL